MRLIYTPKAYSDLNQLNLYISQILNNPSAASSIISHILKSCSSLKQMPYIEMSLESKTKRDTDLRYLICGKHIVFYLINDDVISIIRILDGRTDYMRSLFDTDEIK